MSLSEFELIKRFFRRPTPRALVGPGDDCAIITPQPHRQMAISSDMLVEGRHFVSTVPPDRLGHKALAVNLSDLAACGAQPLGFTLALALPRIDLAWLEAFSHGLFELAETYDCELIGGDTTAGPLNICITAFGDMPSGQALLRSAGQPGDDIYVSGTLGDARLALEVLRGQISLPGQDFDKVRLALEVPEPRVNLGIALRSLAHAAIDLSDGLLGDLSHLLDRSSAGQSRPLGATIWVDTLPRSAILARQTQSTQRLCLLSGGDDYELLFTAAPNARADIHQIEQTSGLTLTRIGQLESVPGVRLIDQQGAEVSWQGRSFDHFAP